MIDTKSLNELVMKAETILLDFDGPVCDVFAGYPAWTVAADLRASLEDESIVLSVEVSEERDPLEILRWTATTLARPELTAYVEDRLRSAELAAVSSAAPTPYAREVIVAAAKAGRKVAIVSNNSAPAIEAYLKAHRLFRNVDSVFGRPYAEPDRMKPNPELLMTAARTLGHTVEQCLFVGDSNTDIFGANAAGMPVIGYANKPHKIDEFKQLGADQVVTSMASIVAALIEVGGG